MPCISTSSYPFPKPVLAVVDCHIVREGRYNLIVASELHVEVLEGFLFLVPDTEVGQLDDTGNVLLSLLHAA